MKKKLALCITAVLLVCLCAGGVTAMAAESELGASAACEGHTLGTFNGVPACVNENGDLHVCENNFPDEGFRVWINKQIYLLGDDGYISETEADITDLEVYQSGGLSHYDPDTGVITYGNIDSLKGIEFFTSLTTLKVIDVGLKELNVSNNKELTYLHCGADDGHGGGPNWNPVLPPSNQLTELDLSQNTALETLYCNNNLLTELDLSKNTNLRWLDCTINSLTKLDLKNNVNLEYLRCQSNKLTDIDLSSNLKLTSLDLYNNLLTSLDVSKNTALVSLNCSKNKLEELDVSSNTALTKFWCNFCSLEKLNVSNNIALEVLYCENNRLTELDISNSPALVSLGTSGNLLPDIDLSQNSALTYFSCGGNGLTELDLSGTQVERVDYTNDSFSSDNGIDVGTKYPQNTSLELTDSAGRWTADLSSVISPENLGKVANLSAGTYDSNTGLVTFDAMPESFTYYYDVGGEFDPMEVVVTVTNPKYEITQGADSTWTESSGDGLTITANGDFDSFTGVKVNGELLDRDNYTAVSGSTVITLKPEYLATLETGTYKLTVVYTDGEANTTFAVSARNSPAPLTPRTRGASGREAGTEKPANPDDVPQTGDSGMIIALTAIFVLTISGFAAVTVYRKKHN